MNVDVGRLPARALGAGTGLGTGMDACLGTGLVTDPVTTARTGPFRP
ncbi:hypothetical protein [Streptomyces sp. NPDC096033]